MTYTLITGGSSGLGKALAHECASRAMNLILISLPGEGLTELKSEIENTYGVQVLPFERDLTDKRAIEDLIKILSDLPINIIINNAGIGGSLKINEAPIQMIDSIILLNIRATSYFSCMLLPVLAKQDRSYILNISSIISQYPTPFKTVYPASKAFIYSFTRGLGEELRNTKTSVSVLLPGPMKTNGSIVRRLEKHGVLGKLLLLDPRVVAKMAITKTLNGKKVIIPGIFNKICWLLMKAVPVPIGISIMHRISRREVEKTQSPVFSSQLSVSANPSSRGVIS